MMQMPTAGGSEQRQAPVKRPPAGLRGKPVVNSLRGRVPVLAVAAEMYLQNKTALAEWEGAPD
jgi:hypothetical protein